MHSPPLSIEATLNYTVNTGEPISYEVFGPTKIGEKSGVTDSRTVRIHDARRAPRRFSLDEHGFELVSRSSTVTDFADDVAIAEMYYPEVVALMVEYTGARKAVVFDHTVRHGDDATRTTRQLREPVLGVHNDYTEWSAPKRVHDILPGEADELLRRRFAIVQLWRPVHGVVQSQPLAIADARSIEPSDLIPVQRRSPDRLGETYSLSYNEKHRWYYYPQMTPDEALIFKVFDSERDSVARFTAHTAFIDPTSAACAPPRHSIEARVLVFFDA